MKKEESDLMKEMKDQKVFIKAPGYEHPAEINVNRGVDSSQALGKDRKFTKIFGCRNCPWKGDPSWCEHGVGYQPDTQTGDMIKTHINGICNRRVDFVQEWTKGVDRIGVVKGVQYKEMMDNSWLADKMMEKANKGILEYDDVLKWRKFASEEKSRVLKHEEGTKVKVENVVDDLRSVVDIKPEEVGLSEEDVRKRRGYKPASASTGTEEEQDLEETPRD